MEQIIFTNTLGISLEGREPIPASKMLPSWFKETPSYVNNEKKPDGTGHTTATIKKCMPVFDAMTSGYIISTHVDLYLSKLENGDLNIEAPSMEPLSFHPIKQAPLLPGITSTTTHLPKWMNPWGIQTPKGYSSLFIAPMHHPNDIFDILPGVVDTDSYNAPVNFIFKFKDPNFTGIIPAGTPIVQVIPFKRESWEMKFGEEKELQKIRKTIEIMRSVFFDAYKNKYRQNKEYK